MSTLDRTFLLCSVAAFVVACGDDETPPLNPGDDVQAALLSAKPGQVIRFNPGTYNFTEELSLSISDVTLRGEGDGVIWNFKGQQRGNANGFSASGVTDLVMENISIVDTKGDAVKVQNATNVTFRKIKVSWTNANKADNGAYGLYPVLSTNILIDECEVKFAADAGIYVGQSSKAIVKNSRAEGNVAGIEIENTDDAEVVGNVATGNTAGILVFNLPNLQRKTGSRTKVHNNMITNNNQLSFAVAGSVVSYVPEGTGMVLFANDESEIHGNTITGNNSLGIVMVSCQTVQLISDNAVRCDTDQVYDPFLQKHYVHDNTFSNNGTAPAGFYNVLWSGTSFSPPFDVLWDSIVAQGQPANGDVCLQSGIKYARVDTGQLMVVSTDASAHACTRPAVPSVPVTW